ITSPLVLEALIEEIRDHVGRIYVVEADQVLEDIESAFHASGMAAVWTRTGAEWAHMDDVTTECSRTGAQWVNMTDAPTVPEDFPANVILKRIDVPRILRQTTLITVPVMKTHAKTGLTGALKNQWGCLSKMRHEYHHVLDDALADLNSAIRPALALMDGPVGLEGNGPKSGRSRIADRILCSGDPVALDTVQATVMGLDPATIRHLATCAARGIGTNDLAHVDVRGMDLAAARVPFLPARHNAVSVVETLLRRSALKRLFFNTRIFDVCLVGAKLYYRAW